MTHSMEKTIESACALKEIPGVVLLATDKAGNFRYEKTFGTRSLKDPNSNDALSMDAVMWIASCTKLMTAVCAMQCVERGLLSLDQDVTSVLHEFKDIEVLTGFDEAGKPILKKSTKTMTLRHLLTHSSGISYDLFNPLLQKYRASQNQQVSLGKTVHSKYLLPLVSEPGTSWSYSASLDWVGKMVERVNDNISLQSYMETHIWGPLGIKDITFHLSAREDMQRRKADMSVRDPTGSGKAILTTMNLMPDGMKDEFGGGGAFATAPEYLKILHSLLADDGKLLQSKTVDLMFQPHLGDASRAALMKILKDPVTNDQLGGIPLGTRVDWGLGGLLVCEDLEKWLRKGTMSWGGMPNLTWWIDREAGLCGFYASQILPPGDAKSSELNRVFQRGICEGFSASAPRM